MADLKNIYATLDIGTNYVKAVVGEVHNDKLYILASSSRESHGIVDSTVVDPNLVVEVIEKVMLDISEKVGVPIKRVVLGVPAFMVSIAKLYGETYITNEDGIIKGEDLQRAVVNATKQFSSEEEEIVNAVPLRYNIDGYVSDQAIGKKASKFGCEIMALTAPSKTIFPYIMVVEQAGYEVIDICLAPLAEQYEVLINEKVDNSTIIMNLGFSSTSISINYNGELKGIGTFAIGINKIFDNIAEKYDVPKRNVIDFVRENGFVSDEDSHEAVSIKHTSGLVEEVSKQELLSYTYHVMLSLLITLKGELEKYDLSTRDKLIVTGGCCELPGFETLFSKVFEDVGELYKPKYIGARSAKYSVAIGLIRYIVQKNYIRGRVDSSLDYESQVKISTPKKKILNLSEDSVISKLFEYFMDKE